MGEAGDLWLLSETELAIGIRCEGLVVGVIFFHPAVRAVVQSAPGEQGVVAVHVACVSMSEGRVKGIEREGGKKRLMDGGRWKERGERDNVRARRVLSLFMLPVYR